MSSQTATILVTDLVASTELRARLGEEQAERLRRLHDRLLRTSVETHGGLVVKGLGDGVLARFPGASEAMAELRLIDGACRCGSIHQRIEDSYGRLDDSFHYGEVTVHPHIFRSALGRHRHILEYQVRQTPTGAHIAVRCVGPADLPRMEEDIASRLARLGLPAPEVVVTPVDRIERQSSGKLKRFVSLAPIPLETNR